LQKLAGYKTLNGARNGDIHLSLIHTCALNPFDYAMALQRHAAAVTKNTADWFPWSHQTALEAPGSG
jgi:hypothetical protein